MLNEPAQQFGVEIPKVKKVINPPRSRGSEIISSIKKIIYGFFEYKNDVYFPSLLSERLDEIVNPAAEYSEFRLYSPYTVMNLNSGDAIVLFNQDLNTAQYYYDILHLEVIGIEESASQRIVKLSSIEPGFRDTEFIIIANFIDPFGVELFCRQGKDNKKMYPYSHSYIEL